MQGGRYGVYTTMGMKKTKRSDIRLVCSMRIDDEKLDWFKDNDIHKYYLFNNVNSGAHISFKYAEDAMAFKLMWL